MLALHLHRLGRLRPVRYALQPPPGAQVSPLHAWLLNQLYTLPAGSHLHHIMASLPQMSWLRDAYHRLVMGEHVPDTSMPDVLQGVHHHVNGPGGNQLLAGGLHELLPKLTQRQGVPAMLSPYEPGNMFADAGDQATREKLEATARAFRTMFGKAPNIDPIPLMWHYITGMEYPKLEPLLRHIHASGSLSHILGLHAHALGAFGGDPRGKYGPVFTNLMPAMTQGRNAREQLAEMLGQATEGTDTRPESTVPEDYYAGEGRF